MRRESSSAGALQRQQGSRVRARQKILSVEPRAGGVQIVNEMTIEIEGQDRPACIAETIGLVYK